jgi:hypothetical protein
MKNRVVHVHTYDGRVHAFRPREQVTVSRDGNGFQIVQARTLRKSHVVHIPAEGRLRTVARAEEVERSS